MRSTAPPPLVLVGATTLRRRGRSSSAAAPAAAARVDPRARCVASARRCYSCAHTLGPSNGTERRSSAVWLDNLARVEVPGVPVQVAWDMWTRKSDIPTWMPWVKSVTVAADDPRVSTWALETVQFNTPLSFSWRSRDLTPVPSSKIHWVSVDGLPNRGAVNFFPRGTGCVVQLSISYELPGVLQPVGDAVRPIVEGILKADMQRFASLAQQRAKAAGGGVGVGR